MPSDLSIGAVAAEPAVSTQETARSAAVSPAPANNTTAGTPNPTLQLDAALGLVVIEFLSKTGAVTSSIPTQRELTAYKDGTAEPPDTQPPQPSLHQKV